MHVVAHQAIREAQPAMSFGRSAEEAQVHLPIDIVHEKLALANGAGIDVMDSSIRLSTGLARHTSGRRLATQLRPLPLVTSLLTGVRPPPGVRPSAGSDPRRGQTLVGWRTPRSVTRAVTR